VPEFHVRITEYQTYPHSPTSIPFAFAIYQVSFRDCNSTVFAGTCLSLRQKPPSRSLQSFTFEKVFPRWTHHIQGDCLFPITSVSSIADNRVRSTDRKSRQRMHPSYYRQISTFSQSTLLTWSKADVVDIPLTCWQPEIHHALLIQFIYSFSTLLLFDKYNSNKSLYTSTTLSIPCASRTQLFAKCYTLSKQQT
jgi:hypothetical protein